MALGASLSNSKKSVVPRAEMDSERAPNSYSFDAQPVQPVDGDLGDALASKNRLSANLSTGLDGVLQVLESLDDKITSADGDVVGERRECPLFNLVTSYFPSTPYFPHHSSSPLHTHCRTSSCRSSQFLGHNRGLPQGSC
jgi:hypothetical protein